MKIKLNTLLFRCWLLLRVVFQLIEIPVSYRTLSLCPVDYPVDGNKSTDNIRIFLIQQFDKFKCFQLPKNCLNNPYFKNCHIPLEILRGWIIQGGVYLYEHLFLFIALIRLDDKWPQGCYLRSGLHALRIISEHITMRDSNSYRLQTTNSGPFSNFESMLFIFRRDNVKPLTELDVNRYFFRLSWRGFVNCEFASVTAI